MSKKIIKQSKIMKYITNISKNFIFHRRIFIVILIKCNSEKVDIKIIKKNEKYNEYFHIFHVLSKKIDCFLDNIQFTTDKPETEPRNQHSTRTNEYSPRACASKTR